MRLIAPKFVTPYRMSASVARTTRRRSAKRFSVRRAFVEATATINRLRRLLSEFGIVLPQKAEIVRREAAAMSARAA